MQSLIPDPQDDAELKKMVQAVKRAGIRVKRISLTHFRLYGSAATVDFWPSLMKASVPRDTKFPFPVMGLAEVARIAEGRMYCEDAYYLYRQKRSREKEKSPKRKDKDKFTGKVMDAARKYPARVEQIARNHFRLHGKFCRVDLYPSFMKASRLSFTGQPEKMRSIKSFEDAAAVAAGIKEHF